MRVMMMTALAVFSGAGAAVACPDFTNAAVAAYEVSGADLFMPKTYTVIAGGDAALSSCLAVQAILVGSEGHVMAAPDFSFALSGMETYRLEVSVESACDSVLLVNDGSANWHFDDDSAGNLDPELSLAMPSDGRLDIWVGTHDGSYCDATLKMETFLR